MSEIEKRMVNLFQALGSEIRLNILFELDRKNRTTSELAKTLGTSSSVISEHLRILRGLGLVWFTQHRNNKVYYLKRKDIMQLVDKAKQLLERTKEPN